MNEWAVVAGIVLIAASGVPGLVSRRGGVASSATLLVAGALLGIAGSLRALIDPSSAQPIELAWSVPAGAFHVEVDALSAMFLIQVFAIAGLSVIYGIAYWRDAPNGTKLRTFFGVMVAGMALLGCARNLVLFMTGWELMAIGAFMAITTEDDQPRVRDAGYLYIIATRVATLAVIAALALLWIALGTPELAGTLDPGAPLAAAIFVLAFIGCGLKAGVMPLHIWLPSAHGNAPSHVSALMSGALIKMGIYALLRFTSLVPHPPVWWGGSVLAVGLLSGVLGVAFAIGQHDLKRLLAYHSVENIGIICIGVGIALIGRATDRPVLVVLGMAGGLLHVWNHGAFKALLFLCAGGVVHATGTREIDHLGGLAHRMRWTSLCFVVGAVAICGLPPLNGFVSELLVYLGLIDVATDQTATGAFWLVGGISAALLALIGALAVACFVKVLGAVFLGQPRSAAAERAHEAPAAMLVPMFVLAAVCFAIGLASPWIAPLLDHAVAAWAPEVTRLAVVDRAPLAQLALVYVPLIVLTAAVARWLMARTRTARRGVGTWDCGYARPSARMQYTSSSFAQMLVGTFAWALRPDVKRPKLEGVPFPAADAAFHSEVPDTVLDRLLVPATAQIDEQRRWVLWIQRGHLHIYVLLVLATLVLLLLWKGGS
jgi:hydrogenase-4 component B